MTAPQLLDDRYRLGDPLGRGGACDVFLGHDERLHRDVAVKVLRGEGVGDAHRMETEAQLLASFNHPGLVQVFDAGQVDGQPYVVLELVEGQTLADRLRGGAMAPEEVAAMGRSVADALASVHERGVVHRDVSPANVLCGADGRVLVADFGIARLVDQTGLTTASITLGTPAFMAPEQVQGLPATAAADVYSLGLVLAEALTGRRAFDDPGIEAAFARLTHEPDLEIGVPDAWRPLLTAMTRLDPADRPTAAEVRDQLDRLIGVAATSTAASAVPGVVGETPVDHDAATVLTAAFAPSAGDTAVLAVAPVAIEPEVAMTRVAPDRRRQRRALVAVLVALLLVVGAGLAQAGQKAHVTDAPATTSTIETPTEPVVSVATTAPAPAAAPAPKPKDGPKAKGPKRHG